MTRHLHKVPAAAAAAVLILSPVAFATSAQAILPDEPGVGAAKNAIPPEPPGQARNDIGLAPVSEPTPAPVVDTGIDGELVTLAAVSALAALGLGIGGFAVIRRRAPHLA